MKKRNGALIALFTIAALILITALLAEGPGKDGGPRHGPGGACHEDVKRLCGDVEKGEGRIRECIKENKDKLSEECRTRMEKGMEMHERIRKACAEDHKKLCGDKKGPEGRKCMQSNRDKLSASCKSAMAQGKAMMEEHRKGK